MAFQAQGYSKNHQVADSGIKIPLRSTPESQSPAIPSPLQAEVSSSGQDVELRLPPNSRIPEGAQSPIDRLEFRKFRVSVGLETFALPVSA